MSIDLLRELRAARPHTGLLGAMSWYHANLMHRAADEIDRLKRAAEVAPSAPMNQPPGTARDS